ncbi:hypothetical protein BJP25_09435 [Actinokineospora bangkokensis]|uniref:ATP-grasp domain-containing protein n=1 Tax=Actinokineospora bangkokensis TaxID=1193682 RepID=A0A1Q9LSC9_9PSEU|nr:hypothetical protein BJP25_09435 [Actinokineospora bangkokensis]
MAAFQELQESLGAGAPEVVVVVPSLTLHSDELRKIPGAGHFEQRLLFTLQLLRTPGLHLHYVTSDRLPPAVVDYALGLVPALAGTDARDRLHLHDCGDDSPAPLTAKLLDRPDLLERLAAAVTDPATARLVVFTSTPLERELALRLGTPVQACDPDLAALGTKSGGRVLLRSAGVPVLDGVEGVSTEADLVRALAELKRRSPGLEKAVVKLNESFAGAGNAVFSYAGAPDDDPESWIARRLPVALTAPGDTWEGFRDKFTTMGGVVEAFLAGRSVRSPSAQLEIEPDGRVVVLSTHDQVLGGPCGQTFTGCAFPAQRAYRLRVQELGLRGGRALAAAGVRGHLSIDFVVDEDAPEGVYALEVNLRMGGATAPFLFTHGLLDGEYDTATGEYRTRDGAPRCYVTSDRVHDDAFRALIQADLVATAERRGLAYDPATALGCFFYALGALPEYGRLGVVAIGADPHDAQRRYDELVNALRQAATATRDPVATG